MAYTLVTQKPPLVTIPTVPQLNLVRWLPENCLFAAPVYHRNAELLQTPALYKGHSFHTLKSAAKSLQSCPTLCDPIDGSPPGSPVPGILQTRTLEWVAISFSNASKWKNKVKWLSRVRLLATPWTAAHQAPPSMGFSRQEEYWSGVPLRSPSQLEVQPI